MPRWRRISCAGLSATAGLGAFAAVALAAHPRDGALYTGSETSCTSVSGGLTCKFEFRVSRSGKTMRLVSERDVAGAFRCPGGGGFAVFGSHKWGYHGSETGDRLPVVEIRRNGTFSGTDHFYVGSGQHRTRLSLTAKGRFTGSGKTAQITFYSQHCVSGPVKLTAQ